jgi:hypothetical protein
MPTTVANQVVLRDEADWELWIYSVKLLAEAGRVWEYINPELPFRPLNKPEKPTRPTATASSASSSATAPIASQAPQATAVDLTQYKIELDEYRSELKQFNQNHDKLGQVAVHITKTISQDLIYLIKDRSTIYDQLKLLQERFSPTMADREYRIQKAYESAKVFHARRSNIEDWCNSFQLAYDRARQLDLPDVHGFRPHKDLIRALKQIDPGYAATIASQIFEAEEAWNLDRQRPIEGRETVAAVLARFMRFYRTTRSTKANIHGGVFAATLNGEESPYNKKRKRQNKPSKPCLCGDIHFWGKCPYIDPTANKQSGFVEDPEKAKKIKAYEAKDQEEGSNTKL